MAIFRLLGRFFVLIALLFAVLGAYLWLSGADITLSAGQLWYQMDSAGLNTTQAIVQRYIHPGLWDNVIVPLLQRPTWEAVAIVVLVFALAGGILSAIGNRRRRRFFDR
jgi:hypothetical protein